MSLQQAHPFVAEELKRWVHFMVSTYEIDALRLDTAAYVPRSYLATWAEAAAVEILGEVTTSNLSYHASYTRDPATGARVLAGVLNFPLYDELPHAFCRTKSESSSLFGNSDDRASGGSIDLRPLAALLVAQGLAEPAEAGAPKPAVIYADVDLLGNFVRPLLRANSNSCALDHCLQ